jgi:hypothetical protein
VGSGFVEFGDEVHQGSFEARNPAASPRDPPATICTRRNAAVRRMNMGFTPVIGVK